MQKGQLVVGLLGLLDDDLDLKSEGRFDLAGENITQRFQIGSFRSCGWFWFSEVDDDDDIVLCCLCV
jgi:hypothetical protein